MPVRKKLNPGQPGTKRPLASYGSRLLRVRYRCDPARQTSKTMEIIAEESDQKPRPRRLRPEQAASAGKKLSCNARSYRPEQSGTGQNGCGNYVTIRSSGSV